MCPRAAPAFPKGTVGSSLWVFGMLGTTPPPHLHSWSYDRNEIYGQVFKIEDTRILNSKGELFLGFLNNGH